MPPRCVLDCVEGLLLRPFETPLDTLAVRDPLRETPLLCPLPFEWLPLE